MSIAHILCICTSTLDLQIPASSAAQELARESVIDNPLQVLVMITDMHFFFFISSLPFALHCYEPDNGVLLLNLSVSLNTE